MFEQLRERNRGGPRFSFIDGPVTANKRWACTRRGAARSRTSSSATRRCRGFDQRYQNGYDCQGCGSRSASRSRSGSTRSTEIEEYGLERFAQKCREVVAWSSGELTRASKRLGQWMDWGNDYFTFSDTNIEYIWRFLQVVHERGWLYLGHRSSEWCPRCGTSLSQHELTQAGVYQDVTHPSLFVRLPLARSARRVARRLDDDAVDAAGERRRRRAPGDRVRPRRAGDWVGGSAATPTSASPRRKRGSDLVGWRYVGPVRRPRPRRGRRSPGDRVGRASSWTRAPASSTSRPGAGREDFELASTNDLAVLTPVDEAGRFYPELRLARRSLHRRGGRADHRGPATTRTARADRDDHATPTRTAGAATRR